jgi:hypothetical protein
MKLFFLFINVLVASPNWSDYAYYNAHYTTLVLQIPNAKVFCESPLPSGNSKCVGKTTKEIAYMLCPAYQYSKCEAWVKVLPD